MYRTLGMAGAGGLAGGVLGQGLDALSAPRRALWEALGLPDSGRELVANSLGLDPDGLAAGALGMGAEMLGDPLTYAGVLGGLGGRAIRSAISPGLQDLRLATQAGNLGTPTEALLAARSGLSPGPLAGTGRIIGGGLGAAEYPLLQATQKAAPLAAEELAPFLNSGVEPAMPQQLRQIMSGRAEVPIAEMFPPIGRPGAPPTTAAQPADVLRQFRSPMPSGEGVAWSPVMDADMAQQMQPNARAVLDYAAAMRGAQLPTSPALPAAAPPIQATSPMLPAPTPFSLPADMPIGAGLTQGYGPQATGMIPLPGASLPYKRLSPEVEQVLARLGMPADVASLQRGGLPPWAQMRGGRVAMQPGVLPDDVVRGAMRAAGYVS